MVQSHLIIINRCRRSRDARQRLDVIIFHHFDSVSHRSDLIKTYQSAPPVASLVVIECYQILPSSNENLSQTVLDSFDHGNFRS